MKQYTLFIGCNVKGKDTYTIHDVIQTVLPILDKYEIAGATFWSGQGYWKSEREATVICSIIAPYYKVQDIKQATIQIKKELHQQTILLSHTDVSIDMV